MRLHSSYELQGAKRTLLSVAAVLAVVYSIHLSSGFAQSNASAAQFDVASIKPTKECLGVAAKASPGSFSVQCYSLLNLIRRAYGQFGNSREDPWSAADLRVEGGPSWIRSVGYDIQAKAQGAAGREVMNGPMLRNLLADRFKLKVHRETRDLPVYALTIAKGGPKLKQFTESSCAPFDPASNVSPFSTPQVPFARAFCVNTIGGQFGVDSKRVEIHGGDMRIICSLLGSSLDRPVIDRTGLTGKLDGRMEFALGQTNTADGVPITPGAGSGRSIFIAVQEDLGLKLEPTRAPVEIVVIDYADRPSEN